MTTNEQSKAVTCKHCGNSNITRCGSYKGVQRYFCKDCRRKFKLDNNLFYMRDPAECVGEALGLFYQGMNIDVITYQLKKKYPRRPSRPVIYKWINKFSEKAFEIFKEYKPRLSDNWILGESFLDKGGKRVFMYDVIDETSRFLIGSAVSPVHSVQTVKTLLDEAQKRTGKKPDYIMVHALDEVYKKIKRAITFCEVEQIDNKDPGHDFYIEYFQIFGRIFEPRMLFLARLRSDDIMQRFIDGWYVNYNFFQPQKELDGKTPAEEAGIDYPVKSWTELVSALPRITHENDNS